MNTTRISVIGRAILGASLLAVFVGSQNLPEAASAAPIRPTTRRTTPTTYLIIACDTTKEADLGEDIVADKLEMQRVFKENVPHAQLRIIIIEGRDLSRQSMLATIRRLVVKPGEDSIVFYYTGHGAYDLQRKEHFFTLPGTKQQILRSTLRDAMIAKSPRAVIMITDCCASGARFRGQLAAKGIPARPKSVTPLFRSLLLNRRGVFSITSSEPDENSITRGDGKGSLFTYHLVKFLEDNARTPLDWEEVVQRLKPTVQKDFEHLTKGKGLDTNRDGKPDQFKQTVHAFVTTPRLGMKAEQINGKLVITVVVPLSPAAYVKTESGTPVKLERGDILLEVNGVLVRTEDDYDKAVDNSPKSIRLKVQNGRSPREVVVVTTMLNPE